MILILGAGLAGLTLARVLHLHGRPFRILDADAGPCTRHQGSMLDIRQESGQWALEVAGLLPALHARTLAGGDGMRVLDKASRLRLVGDGDGLRPEIERAALRDLLLGSLPDGSVEWGARAGEVERTGGGFRVSLSSGEVVEAKVLVGADGAWSRVRPLLTQARPIYSGLTFIESRLHRASARNPTQFRAVGEGLMLALGDGRGFIAHREPEDSLCVYAAFPAPETLDPVTINVESVRARFDGWHPDLLGLITEAHAPLVVRPIHALPVGLRWERAPAVTLVGDAAHLMSPFAGEGANLALQDGAELGLALASHGDLEAALAAYEAAMFPRAEVAAVNSASGLTMCFGAHSPTSLVDFFVEVGAGRVPEAA